MALADFAASAVRRISAFNGKRLSAKMDAPHFHPHNVKRLSAEGYRVGYAVTEVMPDDIHAKTYCIAGHAPGVPVEGVHDPLTVRAVWIGLGDEGGYLHAFADCIGLTGTEVDRVRDMLSDFSRSAKCLGINISCTHTHAGIDTVGYWGKLPRTGKDPEYMEKLLRSIAAVCRKAYDSREDGKLYLGTVRVPSAQFDKREPIVLHDVLTRLRFVPADGGPETWILNFAAHTNTLGGENRLISADYPFYLREKINEAKKVNVLFGIGAIGAVDPGDFCEDRPERTRIQGETLAEAALSMDDDRELPCTVKYLRQPFYCPVDNAVLAFLASLKVMSTKRYPSDKGALGMALKTELTCVELGGLKMLFLPGESFPETVYGGYEDAEHSATGLGPEINPVPLCEICGDDGLLVFGITNDMTGYVVPPNDFVLHETQPYLSTATDRLGRRHYHETNSLGILAGETIAGVFAGMTEKMK